MTYKVCILAAGLGTRARGVFSLSNKALMPFAGKAAISHIIGLVDHDIELVIAVGYKAQDVIEYVTHAHPHRKIEFVAVDPFEGAGSGPGRSLYECRDKLQCPFVVWAVDTLTTNGFLPFRLDGCETHGWIACEQVHDVAPYCSVRASNPVAVSYHDKTDSGPGKAFAGIAGVHDYETFWCAMRLAVEKDPAPQLSAGLAALAATIEPFDGQWVDVGSAETIESNGEPQRAFDFSKPNEATYDVDGRIIKLFADEKRVTAKTHRHALLSTVCPKDLRASHHVVSYQKTPGQTLYERLDVGRSARFFEWAASELWHSKDDETIEWKQFCDACRTMYHDKTRDRLAVLASRTDLKHGTCVVNGVEVASYDDLFARVDWADICRGCPAVIHGDLQFDNVIVTDDDTFVLVDWREDFGGLDYGDVYYDVAKLLGGLTIPYNAIKENRFSSQHTSSGYRFDVETSLVLSECRHELEKFMPRHGLDRSTVETIRALVFAGMAAMHHKPFDELLFYAGRYYLQQALGLR